MITTRSLAWLFLAVLLFLPGCPAGGGGDIGSGETAPSSVAVSPNGSFLYVSNRGSNTVSAYTIGGSGTLAPIAGSPFPAGTSPSAIAISPNGSFLYVCNRDSNNLSAYTIGGTGAIIAITGSPFASEAAPSGVAVSPNGDFLYVSNQGANTVSGYT
ncbi:MAG: beta-propeller fold lactonase family protein, partial [Nitrospira sp.]|nr:beta-propeller fold lactonase family protein [Nitrospira sp.]